MKKFFLFTGLWLLSGVATAAPSSYHAEWRQVDSLLSKGLPQSAAKIAEHVLDEALRDNNAPQIANAAMYRIAAQRLHREEAHVLAIAQVEALIKEVKAPAKNVLHAIAAELYWQHYRANRWAIVRRTPVQAGSDTASDVRTFDLRKIVERCERHYAASLHNERELQKIPVGSYSAILIRQDESEKYRPTLFDVLAFRAADFYRDNDAELTQPADMFTLSKAEYFAPAPQFSACKIAHHDSISFTFRAITLLQKIIAFHLPDSDPTALIDADLHRLDFVCRHAALPKKDSLYVATLQGMAAQYAAHRASAEILLRMAQHHSKLGDSYDPFANPAPQWEKRTALRLAEQAIAQHPGSMGAKSCLALKAQIETPDGNITTGEAVLPNTPFVASVRYKNMPTLRLALLPASFEEELRQKRESSEEKTARYALLLPHAVKIWEVALPDTGDYQPHTTEIAMPALPEGYYALLAIAPQDSGKLSILAESKIWATSIGYVKKQLDSLTEITVLHRATGHPLGGATMQLYSKRFDYKAAQVLYADTYAADTSGAIVVAQQDKKYWRLSMLFRHGSDAYAAEDLYLHDAYREPYPQHQVRFFTDRSVYRPGQTVHFKGLVMLAKDELHAEAAADNSLRVSLHDVHEQQLESLDVRTNEFGSFAGSFTLPAGGLTGEWSLRTSLNRGSALFRVEEYKRPKFEVMLEPTADKLRPGDKATVRGKAVAYAGSAVGGAQVRYSVRRSAVFPLLRLGGRQPLSPTREISEGEATTLPDGSFSITFTAEPDEGVDKKDRPLFTYEVRATVSDVNGETHEATTSVPVCHSDAPVVRTSIGEQVNLDSLKSVTITATNLSGQPLHAQGSLTVWKLRNPTQALHPRSLPRPDKFVMSRQTFAQLFPHEPYGNEDDPAAWPHEKRMLTLAFDTKAADTYPVAKAGSWPAGRYVAVLTACDASGDTVKSATYFAGSQPEKSKLPPAEPLWLDVLADSLHPGSTLRLVAGSCFAGVRATLEIRGHRGVLLKRQTLNLAPDKPQAASFPIAEEHCGGVSVSLFFVKDNRYYLRSKVVSVPYSHKKLSVAFATFRDKLQPGQREEWRITIKDEDGKAVAAELLASMYDAALDAFAPQEWHFFPWVDNSLSPREATPYAFRTATGIVQSRAYPPRYEAPLSRAYDALRPLRIAYGDEAVVPAVASRGVAARPMMMAVRKNVSAADAAAADVAEVEAQQTVAAEAPAVRTSFNETAFFYPQIKTNEKGEATVSFTLPESLTRWKMQGLAWTPDLKVGSIQRELVAQKSLMIFTNPPRFFREGDTLFFSAKLTNLSDKKLSASAQLQLFDAFTMQAVSSRLLLDDSAKTVPLAANGSAALRWKMHVPQGIQAVAYRITATGGDFSDGEENTLPVLTNRMLVTESLPLPIRGKQTKSYELGKLLTHQSPTLRSHALTVEFTGNPAWHAVLALPYLMEYPYECAEQLFSRYYANAVAAHVAGSSAAIRRTFDLWRSYQPEALKSSLEKNEELKSLLIEETPWLRSAQGESEQRRRIATLFDPNRMDSEQERTLKKLQEAQLPSGAFAWFAGGGEDRHITQLIVAGMGRLRRLGIRSAATPTEALGYADARIAADFADIKRQAAERKADCDKEVHLSHTAVHYLYARSFHIAQSPVPQGAQEAFNFFKAQAQQHWPQQPAFIKGMIALALHRYGDTIAPPQIMQSLTETALHSDEAGMYWRSENSWMQRQTPTEAQALLIEAYSEVAGDQQAVNEMQLWLLKQKQTQQWPTTKATAEAVYALLLGNVGQLADGKPCDVTVGGKPLLADGEAVEAGTSYIKKTWSAAEVTPNMGHISVSNPNTGAAWGAAYWQYFEQLDKITAAQAGVQIEKRLFVKEHTPSGDALREVAPGKPIKLGEKVTVRLTIRADRDMDYVHLKDMRAAAFEPVNVLSGYRHSGGLGYYESTRDVATNFFIAQLRKGAYVFEYELLATQQGEFSNGITSLQCMYAPELAAHSEGISVKIE
ncbi:MAG: hypothetical protein LBS63_05990 [Prevotellaceae bacterium]|jgi:uncharacterized protein YfaS (alpha-2-macroglobulin family)|nr:hypothetical protein [Prevotellaceae bacterium]